MTSLDTKLALLRDMKEEMAPAIDRMAFLEKEIKDEILENGEIPEVSGVIVKLRHGYERKTWDSKALEGFAAANPAIEKFRKTTNVKPSVALTFQRGRLK